METRNTDYASKECFLSHDRSANVGFHVFVALLPQRYWWLQGLYPELEAQQLHFNLLFECECELQ
jgi:hypothetical protein